MIEDNHDWVFQNIQFNKVFNITEKKEDGKVLKLVMTMRMLLNKFVDDTKDNNKDTKNNEN